MDCAHPHTCPVARSNLVVMDQAQTDWELHTESLFEGSTYMIMQELLELTDAEIMARVTARKPAAKLVKSVQHLQRSWLQVIRA